MLPLAVSAQMFSAVGLPHTMCGGDTLVFTFGYNPAFDVVVANQRSSLSHPGTVFLPDGEPCGTNGCSYRSPVTFTDFTPGATITSAQNIQFVRLNIEHSYIGDLYINITCPNGQKAVLMRFGGHNDSGCKDAIPTSAATWLTGTNMGLGNYFGMPVDMENANALCDSSAVGNEAGIGWNYCWSDNTSSGYTYASGDGIIYRSGHEHSGRVDSSWVAQGSNFYHPDEHFNSLIGCPLNGSWYIEVVDGYSQDNGYIFDWELALDASLLPTPCTITERLVYSQYAQKINDSTFRLIIPNIAADTTVSVGLAVVNSCGDTIDTTVAIALRPSKYGADSARVCDVYSWAGVDYYGDTIVVQRLHTSGGCDSLVSVSVTVLPSNHFEATDTVIENALPVSFNGTVFADDADTVFAYTNRYGCDSLIHYVLKVWHNVVETYDTAICSNHIPAYWRAVLFHGAGDTTMHLLSVHGADSTVTLHLDVPPAYDTAFADSTCSNVPYLIGGHLCEHDGLNERMLVTMAGCDSMVHVDLTMLPSYDLVFSDTACASVGGVFDGVTYLEEGTYSNSYTTMDGCDSIRTMHLSLKASDLKAIADITPRIVGTENPTVRMLDISEGADNRMWEVFGVTNGERRWHVEMPEGCDSMPITLVAISHVGCTDTAVEMVYLDRSTLFAPNVFTPDREENNRWSPAMFDVVKLEVSIYDRQGRLVYTIEGVDDSWDGTCPGGPCPQGAYVFMARYSSRLYPDRIQTSKGTILLLR